MWKRKRVVPMYYGSQLLMMVKEIKFKSKWRETEKKQTNKPLDSWGHLGTGRQTLHALFYWRVLVLNILFCMCILDTCGSQKTRKGPLRADTLRGGVIANHRK